MATTTSNNNSVVSTIKKVAAQYGVNPDLALAVADVESGLNPTAVGDGGTSFGLFQLHEGGELGNLTEQQAFNPQTNAQVAISHIAAVEKQNPGASPGTIAALAQRPADPSSYAAAVNSIYSGYTSGSLTPQGPKGGTVSSGSAAQASGGGTGIWGDIENLAKQGLELQTNPLGFAQNAASEGAQAVGSAGLSAFFGGFFPFLGLTGPQEFAIRALEILAGGILFGLGLFAIIAAVSGKTGGGLIDAGKKGAEVAALAPK